MHYFILVNSYKKLMEPVLYTAIASNVPFWALKLKKSHEWKNSYLKNVHFLRFFSLFLFLKPVAFFQEVDNF